MRGWQVQMAKMSGPLPGYGSPLTVTVSTMEEDGDDRLSPWIESLHSSGRLPRVHTTCRSVYNSFFHSYNSDSGKDTATLSQYWNGDISSWAKACHHCLLPWCSVTMKGRTVPWQRPRHVSAICTCQLITLIMVFSHTTWTNHF